jgi:hypothetical protein
MSDLEQYAKYFSAGMRVGVGIPMQNNELFRDWAIIVSLENDLVELQLSRDVLPAEVNMQTGKVLELRCGKDDKGYRCSGVFVSDGETGGIQLRLTGDVNTNELREFYRIETFLPFLVQVSQEHNLDKVLKEWRTKREKRLVEEAERREEMRLKRRERIFKIAEGELSEEKRREQEEPAATPPEEELDHIDPLWDTVMASSVNLSAGGFKFITSDHFEVGQIIFLEVFVPTTPPRIMDAVARIAFKNRNYYVGTDEEYWNIAVQFMFIDERDRDAIVQLISNLELIRIRMLRQKALPVDISDTSSRLTPLKMLFMALLFIALIFIIWSYLKSYTASNPKGEIEETFESGIRKYLQKYR